MKELEPLTSPSSEVESLPDYRPVSRLAILSLFLGIASTLAFADPLLIFVPACSAAVSAFTLFRLSRNRTPILGHTAAVIGLMLSIAIGAWTSTRYVTRQNQLYREGAEIGRRWLELVRDNKLYEAHQLHLSQSRRAQPGISLARIYEDPIHGNANFADFQKNFLAKVVGTMDSGSTIRWLSNVQTMPDRSQDIVIQRFAIDSQRAGGTRTVVIEMTMKRTPAPYLHESQWEVVSITNKTE